MLQETIEPAWVDAFEAVLARCALRPGDTVAVLSESQSRPVLPQLARLAAARLGCQCVRDFGADAVRCGGSAGALDRRVHRAAADRARHRGARRQHPGGGLHRGRAHARARAAGHPARRRAGDLREQRTSRKRWRGCCPDDALEPLVKGHVKRLRSARSMRVDLGRRDRPRDLDGGRHLRRQLGLHHPARHHDPLARRSGAGVPRGRQRQRHAGAGRRRRQPHLQALYRAPDHAAHRERLRDEASTAPAWTPT